MRSRGNGRPRDSPNRAVNFFRPGPIGAKNQELSSFIRMVYKRIFRHRRRFPIP